MYLVRQQWKHVKPHFIAHLFALQSKLLIAEVILSMRVGINKPINEHVWEWPHCKHISSNEQSLVWISKWTQTEVVTTGVRFREFHDYSLGDRRKQKTFSLCLFCVGPPSTTLAERWTITDSTSCLLLGYVSRSWYIHGNCKSGFIKYPCY